MTGVALQKDGSLLGTGWDFLLFGPGATLLISALFAALAYAGQSAAIAELGAVLTLALVGPHYAATYVRAYASREIVRAHPLATLVAPVLLAAGAVLAVSSPERVAPFYCLLYVAWSGYHYSGQSLGLMLLYPLRAGARLDAREKRLLSLPLYVSWLLSLLGLLRLGASFRNPAYQLVHELLVPVALPDAVLALALAALGLSFTGVVIVARERRKRGVPLPAACYGVLASQVFWFSFGLYFPLFNSVLVPVFHGLQYLALTSWHQQRGARSSRVDARARFAMYAAAVAALGVVINPGLLRVFVPGGPREQVVIATAAVISFVNLHHFVLDGRIWRLREPRVVQSMLA